MEVSREAFAVVRDSGSKETCEAVISLAEGSATSYERVLGVQPSIAIEVVNDRTCLGVPIGDSLVSRRSPRPERRNGRRRRLPPSRSPE